MKELKGTKTEANLMTAFAGESQARNKYTYYASKARKDGYVQIAKLFEETANNEKEHAKIWFKLLHGGAVPSTTENLLDGKYQKFSAWIMKYALGCLQTGNSSGAFLPTTMWPQLEHSQTMSPSAASFRLTSVEGTSPSWSSLNQILACSFSLLEVSSNSLAICT